MTREEAFIILRGWQDSNSPVSCLAALLGCAVAIVGHIAELSSDEFVIKSTDGLSFIHCNFDHATQLIYSEPKDAIRDVPELAPLAPIIGALSYEERTAGTLSLAFPCRDAAPYLGVIIRERPTSQ